MRFSAASSRLVSFLQEIEQKYQNFQQDFLGQNFPKHDKKFKFRIKHFSPSHKSRTPQGMDGTLLRDLRKSL